MYVPPIKGKPIKRIVSPIQRSDLSAIDGVVKLVGDLTLIKQDIVNTVDTKIEEVDSVISEIKTEFQEIKQIQKGDKGEDADEQAIADWVLSQIRVPKDGKDGKDVDKEEVVREVLKRLPKLPNEAELVAKIASQLPTPKASLKIIKEELQLDKEALLDEILKSPKLKLKIGNIEGLKTTLDVLDRRYIHGGGDTVGAGENITITNVNGVKVISSTGGGSGGGILFETPSGTINGVNTTFTVLNTPEYVISDGVTYFEGQGYTLAGLTITMDVPPVGFIRSAYSTTTSVETPSGTVNGINTSFTVLHTPQFIVQDGVTYFDGEGFTLSGLNITTDFPPVGFIRSFYGTGSASSTTVKETPSGLINSVNVTYTISTTPISASVQLFYNGQLQLDTQDYTLSGTTITFVSPPETGSNLVIYYQY